MPDLPNRLTLDSNCIIDLIKEDVGLGISDDRAHEIWTCRRLIEAARHGELEVFYSTMAAAECTHLKDENGDWLLTGDIKEKIEALLWSGKAGLLPANITIFTLQIIRDLAWNHDIAHSAADMIHVASAVEVGAKEMLTLDSKIGEEKREKIRVATGLKIIAPSETLLLPNSYRQERVDFDDNPE